MPLPIVFDWNEDEFMLMFVLHVRGARAKQVSISLCDVFIRVNCHPALFEVDLRHDIDTEHSMTRSSIGENQVTLHLRKKEPGLWHEFRAEGTKADVRARRQRALAAAEEREKERAKRKDDRKQELLKAGEHEQWRLDRENREQIETWEAEEKAAWERDMYASFGDGANATAGARSLPAPDPDDVDDRPPALADSPHGKRGGSSPMGERSEQSERDEAAAVEVPRGAASATEGRSLAGVIWTEAELDDTEEYVPPVRDNPGKVGLRFTERPRPGVPVRDRGQRQPPHPKDVVKSNAPPMLAEDTSESDPVWLKDKADSLMQAGDYQGAYNAYTEALKLAANARAFANRAVADLYLGKLEQCLEDGNHALRILELRRRTPDGSIPSSPDPEDQVVCARVEVRIGVAYLWLGAFNKAEEHFQKSLDMEDGLDAEDRRKVKGDLGRIRSARAALAAKEKADSAMRHAHAGGYRDQGTVTTALGLYDEAVAVAPESAVLLANRGFARLCAGQPEECAADSDAALECLKRWPVAGRPPRPPARPSRLDPPYLDDPTFKHPNEQKQGHVDWLMKHNGGTTADLPGLPPEYEWVKDAAEKSDTAWIALRRKVPKATIDAIRAATLQLQDAAYSRKPAVIRQQVQVALEQQRAGEGPSNRALQQAEDYAVRLEEHEVARAQEREEEALEAKQELEELDLEKALAPVRAGAARSGLGPQHPAQLTRRRLFCKALLRRARAQELLRGPAAGADDLGTVLAVEPTNPEAKRRLAALADGEGPA